MFKKIINLFTTLDIELSNIFYYNHHALESEAEMDEMDCAAVAIF